jgi:hypothetical protein
MQRLSTASHSRYHQRSEIRDNFTKNTAPNGDLGFTFKVVARKTGVEINGHVVGPREQGWALATEHFGQ